MSISDSKKWLVVFFGTILMLMITAVVAVVWYDPFFHYHAPRDGYKYWLQNQQSQNDGVLKHFDYDAIITGTSMTENFKTSELDALFRVHSVKVPYVGETYSFINSQVETALQYNPRCKMVFRCLDQDRFFQSVNARRFDQGTYPEYLYNENPFDDVSYIFNRDILWDYCLPAYMLHLKGEEGGHKSFDEYSNWMDEYSGEDFGAAAVLRGRSSFDPPETVRPFTEEDRETVCANITRNVTAIAEAHPEVTFYYFFPPYSVAWWGELYKNGELERQLAAEAYVIELLLEHDNIKLYSFNTLEEVVLSLVHYKDDIHYGEWINAQMLNYMAQDQFLITRDNDREYLAREQEQFRSYDYNGLFNGLPPSS